VGTDLIAMTDEICMPAFERAEREYDVPLEHCFAGATHTHTGPEVRRASEFCASAYLEKLPGLVEEAVMAALGNMFDAVLCVGATRAPGLAHNRLSRCADGSEVFGRQKGSAPPIGPAGPEDDAVQTLSVYDTEKQLRAVAVNFACHPDLSGGGRAVAIDADWPGEMSRYMNGVLVENVACFVLQGTAGDINHADHRAGTARWLPGGKSAVARGVAGAALYAMEVSEPLRDVTIDGRRRELEVPYYTRDATLFRLVEDLKAKGENATYFERELVKRVEQWPNDGKTDRFAVSCLRLGDLAFAAMPGEIFTAWGLEIKRFSPARWTFVVELASSHDGVTGYKPTSDQALRGALARGAYGALPTLSQKHCPAAGQMMTDAAIAMLHELWAPRVDTAT